MLDTTRDHTELAGFQSLAAVAELDGHLAAPDQKHFIEIDLLEQELGPRFHKTSRRRVLNLAFWSGLLERQFKPSHDPSLEKFQLRMANTQVTVWLSESAMVDAVFRWLEKLSHLLAGFPAGELRLARSKELVRMLKNSVTRGQPSEGEVIVRFLQEQVEVCQGMMLTSRQLWVGFRAFCQTNKQPLCPKTLFLHLVREKIRKHFHRVIGLAL